MAEEIFVDEDIQALKARIQYKLTKLPDIANWLLTTATVGEDVYLCHRKDYHSDGPPTSYYYIELNGHEFLAMGGKELED